jgi:hypothetical protein
VLGQLPCGAAPRPGRPQLLDQGVEAVGAVHGRSVDAGGDSPEILCPQCPDEALAVRQVGRSGMVPRSEEFG